ncbi:MAG: lysophospholipid acyltransferase family protein [Vicinamibacteria bacterium]
MKHLAEYLLARAASVLGLFLPLRLRLSLGRALGALVYALDGRHRRITLANVDMAFGDEKTESEKQAIACGAFRHFGAMLFEMITLGRPSWRDLESRVDFEGVERFEDARRRGKGVIMVGAHFGNWELHAIAHGFRIGKMHLVAREQNNGYLNRWLEEVRKVPGNEVIYKQRALGLMRKLLREGATVGFVIDQNVRLEDAVFVDFFGRKAATTPVASWFALKTGASLVPVFCHPIAGGRYRIVYEEPVDLKPYLELDRDEAIIALTQSLATIQEKYIRREPEYWLWMHRRWRTRPPKEKESPIPALEAEAALT